MPKSSFKEKPQQSSFKEALLSLLLVNKKRLQEILNKYTCSSFSQEEIEGVLLYTGDVNCTIPARVNRHDSRSKLLSSVRATLEKESSWGSRNRKEYLHFKIENRVAMILSAPKNERELAIILVFFHQLYEYKKVSPFVYNALLTELLYELPKLNFWSDYITEQIASKK